MSQIDDLLAELCPGGVERHKLSGIVRIRNGRDYKSYGPGAVPVYGSGGVMTHIDTTAYNKPSVLIPRKGSLGNLFYVDPPFWTVDTIFYTEIDDAKMLPKFLYYFLTTLDLAGMNQAGGVPSQTQSVLNELMIPVPPIEVQGKIVEVLDTFSALEAELEAELEARRRQYEYYRDSLLSFREAGGVLWLPMGEVGSLFGGLTGKSKADFTGGNARFISYVNVFSNIAVNMSADDFVRIDENERQRALQRGDVLFTGSSETPEEVGMSSVVTDYVKEPLYLNSFSIGYRLNDPELLNPEFAKHLFRSHGLRQQIVRTASGVTRFNVSKARLSRVLIPIPELRRQRQIADMLDAFRSPLKDLSVGLPAEMKARRRQYEYYRDKLLTFEEAVV